MSIIWDIEKTIDIGYQNEHNARTFAFDISEELEKWPSASPHIVVQRPGNTKAVRGESNVDGNTIVWTVTRKDTQLNGNGKVWVAFIDGEDLLGYSFAANIVVHDAPDVDDIVEEEVVRPWIEQIREYLESAQACAQASLDAAKRAEDAAKKAEEVGGNVSADMLEEAIEAYMQDHPPAEIVDNLTTNESTKALSAAQGVNLKSQIDEIANDVQSGESAIQELSEDVESITKGAYFGTEKPSDPSVFLWVDPTDSGGAAESVYEPIETIVCDGTYGTITRKNVSYKRVLIAVHTTAAEAATAIGVEISNGAGLFGYAYIANFINTSERWSTFEAVSDERSGAYIDYTSPSANSYNSGSVYRSVRRTPGDTPINRIHIYATEKAVFPDKTTIEIKAVRA